MATIGTFNQIEKAYGQNNAILDNCHVRVSFATNDERTAKRVSDALGTATEIRDARNYAGHRLSPWLGHLMISRQETARPLLTPGEIMQLPLGDELVLVSGLFPIRVGKARYFEDRQLQARVIPPPQPTVFDLQRQPAGPTDDWTGSTAEDSGTARAGSLNDDDQDNGGIRREPELPIHEAIDPPAPEPVLEPDGDEPDDEGAVRARLLNTRVRSAARQATMDPDDGIAL